MFLRAAIGYLPVIVEDVLLPPCCLSGAEYPRAYEHACSYRWRLSSAYFCLADPDFRICRAQSFDERWFDNLVPTGNGSACPIIGIRTPAAFPFRFLRCRDELPCRRLPSVERVQAVVENVAVNLGHADDVAAASR